MHLWFLSAKRTLQEACGVLEPFDQVTVEVSAVFKHHRIELYYNITMISIKLYYDVIIIVIFLFVKLFI